MLARLKPTLKRAVAGLHEATGLNRALHAYQRRAWFPYARAVNYHGAPRALLPRFEEHLRWFADAFVPVDLQGLLDLQAGRWPHDRPGILITFDDGLREVYDTAAPALERFGMTGWFFVCSGFIDTPSDRQRAYARTHQITCPPAPAADPRIALSWTEVRDLRRRGHVIGSHTTTHWRLAAGTPPDRLRAEIADSRTRLERELGEPVPVFCWVGGEERSYSAEAARAIREAGFTVAFQTNNEVIRPGTPLLQLQRTNLEFDNPLSLVRFQLSGVADLVSTGRRRRVRRVTG